MVGVEEAREGDLKAIAGVDLGGPQFDYSAGIDEAFQPAGDALLTLAELPPVGRFLFSQPSLCFLGENKAAQPDRKQERVWLGQLLGSLGILGCGCYRHPAFQLILRPRGGCSPTIPHVVFLISYIHVNTYGLCAHYLRSHPLFPHSP